MTFEILKNRPFLPLASERLLLRPICKSDAETLAKLANNYNISKTTARMPYPYSLQDAHDFIERKIQEMKEESPTLVLSVFNRTSYEFLGVISYENGTLGYWLGEPFWGQGFMKEAFHSFIHFLFDFCEIPEFEISALPSNAASVRIIEGAGCLPTFQKELYSNATQSRRWGQYYTLTRENYWSHYCTKDVPVVWVVAAAILKDQKLLVAERPQGKSMAGVWELPGGKIESGETPEAALARELHEELGIEVRLENLKPLTFASYRYPKFHLVMPFFTLTTWSGNLHGKEGQNLAWISYSDLEKIPTPAADIALFHKLGAVMKNQGLWE